MRTSVIASIVAFATVTYLATAQEEQRTTEISLGGTFGSVKQKMSSGGTSHEGESETYGTLSLKAGFTLVNGLAIEPEFMWSAFEGSPPCMFLVGNLTYSFAQAAVSPFISVGYGVGNAVPIANVMIFRTSDKLDVALLTLGGGLKFPVTSTAFLRIEFRHQQYSYEREYSYYGYPTYYSSSMEYSMTMENVFLGFSVLL